MQHMALEVRNRLFVYMINILLVIYKIVIVYTAEKYHSMNH